MTPTAVAGHPTQPPAATAADAAIAVEFLLRFARDAHDAGYPTADLEERILSLAGRLGLEAAQVSATPTLVEISVGELPRQRSYTLRVRPTFVDLGLIARLDGVVDEIEAHEPDPTWALELLDRVEAAPFQRRRLVRLAAYAVAGAAVTPVLGGGWRELLAGAVVGLVVGAIAIVGLQSRAEAVVAPLAAVAASFCAVLLADDGVHASPDVVTLAALVSFLPGMALTIGMRELATEHLQSGVANTASALVQLLGLVFGVGVGRSVATSWFGPAHAAGLPVGFGALHVAAAAAAGLAFTVTLRAQWRAAPVMCSATVLAILANAVGKAVFGATAGVFLAALAIGVVGGAYSRVAHRSALVFIVPGVLMLVPGSVGFNSLLQLLAGQTVSGIEAGFNTFVTAMSIAYGLMISTLIVAPKPRESS